MEPELNKRTIDLVEDEAVESEVVMAESPSSSQESGSIQAICGICGDEIECDAVCEDCTLIQAVENIKFKRAQKKAVSEIVTKFEYGLQPVFVIKKSSYTQAHKKAQQKYRDNNRDEYNALQRALYDKQKLDEDWKKKFNERSRENNKIYRDRLKAVKLSNPDYKPPQRGRPKKVSNITPQF